MVAFSSESPVDTYDYSTGRSIQEVLSHCPEDMDMSRMNNAHPVLLNHNQDQQIGVIERAEISPDKIGRALIRFGESQLAQEIFRDVQTGVRRHLSVGYQRMKALSEEKTSDGKTLVRYSWMPFEVSIVPVPADPSVGVGRSQDGALEIPPNPPAPTAPAPSNVDTATLPISDKRSPKQEDMNRLLLDPNPAGGGGATPPAPTPATPPPVNVEEVRNKTIEAERTRTKNIRAAAAAIIVQFPDSAEKFRTMADEAEVAGKTSEDFNADLLKAIPGMRKADIVTAENLGMSRRDVKQYSLIRGIQSVIRSGRQDAPEGLEGEVHKAMAQRVKAVSASGFWVPSDMLFPAGPARGQRDMNVTTSSQGGSLVETSLMLPIIELFRNRMVCSRLGVQSLTGLEGNVAIPRQTGAATAYSLAESASLTKSTQAIDQIALSPHRVGATNDYTKQLLLQSSADIENFIRDDLMKVLAIKWDKLILEGSGSASEPTGILHTGGIGSVHFGAAATFAKMVEFETALSNANADQGRMAYVTNTAVRGVLKTKTKVASSTFPIYIWEPGDYGDGSNDGTINSYRAAATNQIANNLVAFGNFEDAIHALWGGYDVVVNPFSRDVDAVVRITINSFGDVAVRHAASFAWSDDSGAQ